MIPAQPVLPGQLHFHVLETVFAKDQPEYLPLPAIVTDDGTVITRWKLSWRERLRVMFSGNLYLSQMTFGEPLQPQLPSVDEPQLSSV